MPGQPNTELSTAGQLIVLDPNTAPSNLIVDEDLEFFLVMEFRVTGISVALLGLLEFEVVYSAESIGVGDEKVLGTKTGTTINGQPVYNDVGGANSQTTLRVAPHTLRPGVYRLAAVVTFKLVCGAVTRPWPVTGFVESPAIQVTP